MKTKYEVKLVNIADIDLDKSNPRIAKFIEMHGNNVPAEQIALALGVGDSSLETAGTTFQSLKASIRTNEGIIHPIIVNKEKNNRMVAIEGNTRVAIYKEFLEKSIPGKWDKIIALVYDSMSQEEIDAIRLQSHLVGPRPWDPYSKAKYLEYLRNKAHLTFSQIVDYCGGNKREVENYIEAYLTMESQYRPLLESDDQFDPTRFSAFVELEKKPNIKTAIINAGFTLKDFAQWVIDLKLYPLHTVRSLPAVLGNPKSKNIFLKTKGKGAMQKALLVIEAPASEGILLKDASLSQLIKECISKYDSLLWEDLKRLKNDATPNDVQDIFDFRDRIVELCNEIESV